MKLKNFCYWDGFIGFSNSSSLRLLKQQATSSQVQKVIDESYVQPDYVMGYSLSEEQRNET